jgi:hypothetical protein
VNALYGAAMLSLCRILNVGPDSQVHHALEILQTEGVASLRHAETGGIAIGVLGELPDSDLPELVIIPLRLPMLTCIDFIALMYSHPRLRGIRILVWGPHIRAQEIDHIYAVGAFCVLPGQFGAAHLDAVRQFCHSRTSTPMEVPTITPPFAIVAPVSHSEKATRNARLGVLFVWTGCVSATLWACSFLRPGLSFRTTDLVPLLVYAALTYAGMSLMWRPTPKASRGVVA